MILERERRYKLFFVEAINRHWQQFFREIPYNKMYKSYSQRERNFKQIEKDVSQSHK